MTDPIDALSAQYDAEHAGAVAAAPPRCLCGHDERGHALSTGRCRSVACGCTRMRPREAQAPRPVAPTPPARTGGRLPELVPCGECNGSGQGFLPGDPDYRWYWCLRCYGSGVVEVAG